MKDYLLLLHLCFLLSVVNGSLWECLPKSNSCQRKISAASDSNTVFPNPNVCKLACGAHGNVWPQPASFVSLNKEIVHIDANNAAFTYWAITEGTRSFIDLYSQLFTNIINESVTECNQNVYKLVINLIAEENTLKLNWNTSEVYDMQINTYDSNKTVAVTIQGATIYGVRHGLETLLQLIQLYNDNEQICYVTLKDVSIHDKPAFKHRGLLLDSARNFLSVGVIKKTIVAMSMSKMNVLHWHISDSQSFPFESSRVPNMSKYGAYSKLQMYTPYQIRYLIQYGKFYGVRIIPEIDGPAHAGSGWQWGPAAGIGNLTVCYNQQPYKSYCIQPPCGQMNPANPHLYEVLKDLYADMIEIWTESDVFHMGGDEVYMPCWNSSQEILDYINTTDRSEEVFLKLWAEYQQKALKAYDLANRNAPSSIILWTSKLTNVENIESYLPKDRYVIQTWVPKSDTLPEELIKLGYRLIISTKDSWYLDHGFWGTTSYYTWRNVYDNTIPTDSAVLGGEVCMWGELVDDNNVEPRVWPRAAAAAERLWSNPTTTSVEATARFFSHNDRLVKRGIRTSPVGPEYCTRSEFDCEGYLTQ